MPEEKPVVMYDSPDAAQPVVLLTDSGQKYGPGWLSASKRYFHTEDQARRDGATHRKCEVCEEVYAINSYCHTCQARKVRESYLKMPFQKYDGKSMLTLHDDNTFFSDESEVFDYCENNEIQDVSTLPLVICEPNYLSPLDGSEWADIMPEEGDGELPKDVEDALKVFNEVIKKQGPVSWSAGKYRTTIEYSDDERSVAENP